MRKINFKLFFIAVIILVVSVVTIIMMKQKKSPDEIVQEIAPVLGSIKNFISCTATVLPKNRLEVKPPVSGRIESILVKEGEKVKTGQVLAWMSSAERAALLDAALAQGATVFAHWEQAYRPTPVLSLIHI